jgi:hypothetical protein
VTKNHKHPSLQSFEKITKCISIFLSMRPYMLNDFVRLSAHTKSTILLLVYMEVNNNMQS